MTINPENRIAFITGANRGIGRAITEALLDAGAAKVYGAVRDPSSLDELVEKYGERIVPIQFDLTRKETVDAAAKQATDVTIVTGYSASKAASHSVTQGLREAWADQGTQVMSVLAGPIKTDMADSVGMGEGAPPPSLVADSVLAALESGDFFVYPDPMAKQVAEMYTPFAENVLEIAR